MTDTPKPTEGGRYELIDGRIVQHQAPTAPGEGGPRNADGSSMYTTDKFRVASPAVPAVPAAPAVPALADLAVPAETPAEADTGDGAGTPKKKR